jgi:hypothetical protein
MQHLVTSLNRTGEMQREKRKGRPKTKRKEDDERVMVPGHLWIVIVWEREREKLIHFQREGKETRTR